ncbi:MAG: pyridoxal phosphate-dependent aminotransferase [Lactobacillales bacterium]|jgi:cystathionine beta-lyase|nr:pyridoxal phosphate-dependent aminotransferase [Lactobacillales bacterium]
MYDFQTVINRRNTNNIKWDSIGKEYHEDDLLPLWIADMDFRANPKVLEELQKIIDFGIIGYSDPSDSLYEEIIAWQKIQHQYEVPKEAILFSSGVVPSISLAIQAYTEIGDAVLINNPVYPPFARSVKLNQRKLVENRLVKRNNHYEIDFDLLEKQLVEENVKLYLLCNPQNPGGRVWTKEELNKLGALCKKHHVLVASDEIHEDLVFAPSAHTTFANAGEDFADFSITMTAATKTFNLAGIKNSMVFIESKDLREKFSHAQLRNNQHEIGTFGLVGTEAAYKYGDEWLLELKKVLAQNLDLVEKELVGKTKIEWMRPEGTYLAWLDFSNYGLTDKEIEERLIHKGKVVLNAGISFGNAGTQHMRLNVAAPKITIDEGIKRIKLAFEDLEN